MADKTVSEMDELSATDIANNDFMYIVDTSAGGNGSKKVSIANLRTAIGGGDSDQTDTGLGIPSWKFGILLNTNTAATKYIKLPCDCFIQAYVSGGNGVYPSLKVDGQNIPGNIYEAGIYCSRGSTISFQDMSPYIFPILRGDESENSFIEYKERQTPQQITQFINDNMGEKGRGYFQPISGYNSGMFGRIYSSAEWNFLNNPDDEIDYSQYGWRCNPSESHYIYLKYPGSQDNYNRFLENKPCGWTKTLLTSKTSVTQINSSRFQETGQTQADFRCLDIIVFKLETEIVS